jgi:GNAT superfamily N-acetyltransferase
MTSSFAGIDLGDGYAARPITYDEYLDALARLEGRIFGHYFAFDTIGSLTGEARARLTEWRAIREELFNFCLGIYHGDELVGWHYSQQTIDGGIKMLDTGMLPEHRGKGLYSRLLPTLIEEFRGLGFDHILSHHRATNNAVIIPKLRVGFVIFGFEMDEYGLAVKLIYPFNPLYRASLDVRSGLMRPEGRVAELLGLRLR